MAPNEPEEKSYRIVCYHGDALPQDIHNYVKKCFLRNLRDKNDYFKLIEHKAFWDIYPKFITALLNKPNSKVSVAMLDGDIILGWSMFNGPALHFVYVRNDARRNGIAAKLIPKEITQFTHITNDAIYVWQREQYKRLTFNPFAI